MAAVANSGRGGGYSGGRGGGNNNNNNNNNYTGKRASNLADLIGKHDRVCPFCAHLLIDCALEKLTRCTNSMCSKPLPFPFNVKRADGLFPCKRCMCIMHTSYNYCMVCTRPTTDADRIESEMDFNFDDDDDVEIVPNPRRGGFSVFTSTFTSSNSGRDNQNRRTNGDSGSGNGSSSNGSGSNANNEKEPPSKKTKPS